MPRKAKHFADWLVLNDRGELIVKGTENIDRYPNGPLHGIGILGIEEYGTQKVDGKTCLKIGADDTWGLINLGWTLVDKKTHYAYMLPPEVN